jgi:hypothetical protein
MQRLLDFFRDLGEQYWGWQVLLFVQNAVDLGLLSVSLQICSHHLCLFEPFFGAHCSAHTRTW